jgi:hypothetical protein
VNRRASKHGSRYDVSEDERTTNRVLDSVEPVDSDDALVRCWSRDVDDGDDGDKKV